MADRTELTVGLTQNWAWNREYNLQLTDQTRAEHFPDVDHGEFLLLEAEHEDTCFAVFGKVDLDETDHLEPGETGVGMNLRYALGVTPGETVCVADESPPEDWTRKFDELFGRRPVICRVRKGVLPDVGFDVCRVGEATMDDLGITPGDHVVIESTEEVRSLKALPLREEITDRKRRQTEQNPDRYPDPAEVLDLDRLGGTDVDLPEIYLDSGRREDLALEEQTNDDAPVPMASGICQPVKVSRNATSVYLRSLNEVSVPVILGLFAAIFVFEPWLTATGRVALVVSGILFIILSITYRVRKTTLD